MRRIVSFTLLMAMLVGNVPLGVVADAQAVENATSENVIDGQLDNSEENIQPSDILEAEEQQTEDIVEKTVFVDDTIIVNTGDIASIFVKSTGEVKAYRWYYSKDGGNTWGGCQYGGYKSDTLSFTVSSWQFGLKFKCLVTFADGEQLWTNEAELVKPTPVSHQALIEGDPYANSNGTVSIKVVASEGVKSYRWYYSKDAGATWNANQYGGYKTDTLSFTVASWQFGLKFKCFVTFNDGEQIWTNDVTLQRAAVNITSNPEDNYTLVGDYTDFTVSATGEKLSYRWYYSKDSGVNWSSCQYTGYKTARLAFNVSAYQYNYQFKCLVTDMNGNVAESTPATLKYPHLKIVKQPENIGTTIGESAVFSIDSEGYKQTYEWYYSKDSGNTWKLSPYTGRRTSVMTVSDATISMDGYRFYCLVKNIDGTQLKSDTVTLTVTEQNTGIKYSWDDDFTSKNLDVETAIFSLKTGSESAQLKNEGAILEVSTGLEVTTNDVIFIHFEAKANETGNRLKIIAQGNKKQYGTYALPVEWTEYIIPITGFSTIENITFELLNQEHGCDMTNLEIVNIGNTDSRNFSTGLFYIDTNSEEIVFTREAGVGQNVTDMVSDGEYLYSIYRGALSVYDVKSGAASICGTVSGLGNTRDICVINGRDALAITSRENGVYFVDIADKTKPQLITNLDTLGLATGIQSIGDYVLVCSRYCGIEIFDVSDLSNPEYVSCVSTNEEYYDCSIYENYMYVSCWGQKKICVYDISNVSEPMLVNSFKVNGCPGSSDAEGGYLYISTGYNGTDDAKSLNGSGYGYGSGMEIYDISNPSNPQFASSVRIDGRYYYSGSDHWKVNVMGKYAFLSHTFNGEYIYDISNPLSPVRVKKVAVRILKGETGYKYMDEKTSYILPFDNESYSQMAISNATAVNGVVYLGADCNNGIYSFNLSDAVFEADKAVSLISRIENSSSDDIEVNGWSSQVVPVNSSVSAITYANQRVYTAAGISGINVYDESLNLISTVKTKGVARDIKYLNGYLYVAESDQGLGVYSADADEITEVARCNYNAYNTCFTAIGIMPDYKHLIVQAGWTMLAVVDISNPMSPKLGKSAGGNSTYKAENCGTMYSHNIFTGGTVAGKYVGTFDRNSVLLFSQDELGNVQSFSKVSNTLFLENGGAAVLGDGVLVTTKTGYAIATVEQLSSGVSTCKNIPVEGITSWSGVPYVNGNMLVVTDIGGSKVSLIDISDINAPRLLEQVNVDGNPDGVEFIDDSILVALRHGGILKLTRE